MKLAASLSLVAAFIASTCSVWSQDLKDRAYAKIVEEVRGTKIEAAWLWIDVYSDTAEEEDYFSPTNVLKFSEREIGLLNQALAQAAAQTNTKNLLGERTSYAIVIKPDKGPAFGLLRNPRHSADLFTLIAVEIAPKPVITGRLDLRTLVRDEAGLEDKVSGINLPGLLQSKVGEFIASSLRDLNK
ncbi:hypothetical protein [Luteolibacter luteus]|uniref:Uncharacterized protein n=1 Tax=Luteolibacter luteus TaxID=2728835 RepID=A0A858RDF3_9BACT|nr:hypothetical protein [Luteolibacter luteus]QJE94661.1 hypothetical protein HHL09_02310 [Luteolibacter luteus]